MHIHATTPPFTPPNAAEAVKAHQGCRARAEQMLRDATTADERQLAQFWIDKADREIDRWQAIAERSMAR